MMNRTFRAKHITSFTILIVILLVSKTGLSKEKCLVNNIDYLLKEHAEKYPTPAPYQSTFLIMNSIKKKGIKIEVNKNIDIAENDALIKRLTKKHYGQALSRTDFLKYVRKEFGTWQKMIRELGFIKRKASNVPTRDKYLSFIATLKENNFKGDPLNKTTTEQEQFMSTFFDFFDRSTLSIEQVADKIDKLFGNWDNSVKIAIKLKPFQRIKSNKKLTEEFLIKLYNMGYDVSRYSFLDEIDKSLWEQLTLEHFKRKIGTKYFKHKINTNLGGLRVALKNANIDINFSPERYSRHYPEIKKIMDAIGINKKNNFFQNRNHFEQVLEQVYDKKLSKFFILKSLDAIYGKDKKYFTTDSLNFHLPKIKEQMEIIGINKSTNFLQNRNNLKQVIKDKTGNEYSDSYIDKFIRDAYKEEKKYFHAQLYWTYLPEIKKRMKKLKNYKDNTQTQNKTIFDQVTKEVIGKTISDTYIYQFIKEIYKGDSLFFQKASVISLLPEIRKKMDKLGDYKNKSYTQNILNFKKIIEEITEKSLSDRYLELLIQKIYKDDIKFFKRGSYWSYLPEIKSRMKLLGEIKSNHFTKNKKNFLQIVREVTGANLSESYINHMITVIYKEDKMYFRNNYLWSSKNKIKEMVIARGMNKTGNFSKNKRTLIQVIKEVTGKTYSKNYMNQFIKETFKDDSLYFHQNIFLNSKDIEVVKKIFFTHVKNSNWDFNHNSLNENYLFVKSIIEQIFGERVWMTKVYRYIIILDLDFSHFKLKGKKLDYMRQVINKTYKETEFIESKLDVKLKESSYNPLDQLIKEEEALSELDFIDNILNTSPFKDPSNALLILEAIINKNIINIDDIVQSIHGITKEEVIYVFEEIKRKKDQIFK